MNISNEAPLAYRVSDFCRRIGISRSTFYALLKREKIHVIRLGGGHWFLALRLNALSQAAQNERRASNAKPGPRWNAEPGGRVVFRSANGYHEPGHIGK
jgi:hypothetical protein